MLFRSEGNMTTDADVEENDPNGIEDEGEHPEDLQNETEDAASASTSTSTNSLVCHTCCGGSHSFYYTLYMYFCSPRKRARRPPTPDDLEREILKELKKDSLAPPDEDDLFGQSIGASLKKMAPQQNEIG